MWVELDYGDLGPGMGRVGEYKDSKGNSEV